MSKFDRNYEGKTISEFMSNIKQKTDIKQNEYFYSTSSLLSDTVFLYALKNSDNDCSVVPLKYGGSDQNNQISNYSIEAKIINNKSFIITMNNYTIPNIIYSLIRCSKQNKLLAIPFYILFYSNGKVDFSHTNVLIINYRNKTIERFEPQYETEGNIKKITDGMDKEIQNKILKPIEKELDIKLKYISPYSECPDLQSLQSYENEYRKTYKKNNCNL